MNRIKNVIKWFLLMSIFVGCDKQDHYNATSNQAPQTDPEVLSLTDQQIQTIDLQTQVLEPRNIQSHVEATGYIHVPPQYIAGVSPFMGGYVKTCNLLEGDYVKKGQMLATMENPEYLELQREYLESQSMMEKLAAEYDRTKALIADSITSEKELINAKASYQSMLAKYNSISEQLNMLNINREDVQQGVFSPEIILKAPISGYISKANYKLGKFITPGDEMFEIMSKDHLHLELKVYEKDAMQIKKGQSVQFTVPSVGSRIFTAEVFLVGQVLEGEDRVLNVHAHIDPEFTEDFVAHMYVNASIITSSDSVLAVDENAVVRDGETSYIFIKNRQTSNFSKIEVDTGNETEGFIQIYPRQTLNPGEEVVTHGAFYLLTMVQNAAEI